jgi:hypothetical protein
MEVGQKRRLSCCQRAPCRLCVHNTENVFSFHRAETLQSLERLKREARTLELRVEFKLSEFARMDSGSMAVVDPEAGAADQERVHIKEIEDYLLQVGGLACELLYSGQPPRARTFAPCSFTACS